MIEDIEQRINAHHDKVTSTSPQMPEGACVKCLQHPGFFALHDGRQRSFRFTIRDIVRVFMTMLLRWKCPLCKATFTDYPPFAIPYKRFVRDDIERFSSRYVKREKETYRCVVRHERTAIGYDQDCERQFEHSTVWKWLRWLGEQEQRLTETLEWIRYHDPSHGIFRELTPIAPKKYRSEKRKHVLEQARMLLLTAREYLDLFKGARFPRLETSHLRF